MRTVWFSAVLYAEGQSRAPKSDKKCFFNKTDLKYAEKLKKVIKNKHVEKNKKIFVKITKSSKSPCVFCESCTKKRGFFDVFAIKKS